MIEETKRERKDEGMKEKIEIETVAKKKDRKSKSDDEWMIITVPTL